MSRFVPETSAEFLDVQEGSTPFGRYSMDLPLIDSKEEAAAPGYLFRMSNVARSQCASDAKPRLTKVQHEMLQVKFEYCPKPSTQAKNDLAQTLGIPLDNINNWFQNRRARIKQEMKKTTNDGKSSDADAAQYVRFVSMLQPSEKEVHQNFGDTREPGPSDGDIYPSLLPAHVDDTETTVYVPDWSFVQRRYEMPHLPLSNDCPSMTTGSTISSRNSSTRSSKSFRLDGVEQPEKGTCPMPECGRVFKDLTAHMVTHQAERPEKCPVEMCEYHVKGFARAYDRDRHIMSHFKGSMICGFCPSPEKSFRRSDVFMRHLLSIHGGKDFNCTGVTRQPRRSSETQSVATCNLCAEPFDPQGFHKHLLGCIIRQVTNEWKKPQVEQSDEKVQAEPCAVECKDSPRNDSVVTPVHELTSRPFYSLGENRPLRLDGPHAPFEQREQRDVHNEQDSALEAESKEIEEITASSRCLSLTSSNGEVVKSSDEETDWTEDVGSPFSEPDATGVPPMLSPVKRQLVNTIMREFHRLFDESLRTCHGGGSSNAGYGTYGSSSSGSSTYSSSSFISRKRSLSGGSTPPPNDNGDDGNKRRRPDPKSSGVKQAIVDVRYACPYFKRNPGRHQTFTSCRDPGFITVARLKEHLYRRHLLPIQCNRCCSTFPNEPTLREHQRDPNGCEIREQIALEGFDKDQERKLKSKKRSLVYQSEEDKWKGVYRILFPDDNEEDMPSPYIEYQPCHANQTGESTNIARFHEFSRLELPRLVRRTLEVAVEEEAQPLEEKLKERLVDIVRECQTQLISLFQSTGVGAAQGVNPSELALAPALAPVPEPEQQSLQTTDSHSAFQNFDSFANTSSDYVPIPASQYHNYDVHKADISAAEGNATGSPDSGYDSAFPAAVFPQDPGFQQDMVFRQQPQATFGHHTMLTDAEYVDLGGYYGLFENRGVDFDGVNADPSWAHADTGVGVGTANAHRQVMGDMGAGGRM